MAYRRSKRVERVNVGEEQVAEIVVTEPAAAPGNGNPAEPPAPVEAADPTVGMGPKELARWLARQAGR